MASANASPSISALIPLVLATAVLSQGEPASRDPAPAKAQGKPAAKASQPEPAPVDAKALFAAFARLRGLSAKFTEEKHLSLLAVPLKSSGELHFLAPSHLARLVKKPERSKVTISDKELRMQDAHGTEVIDLRQSDRVRLFVTSLMRVFQGDREALSKAYRVHYQRDPDDATRWRLELQPKQKELQQILKQLVLHGQGRSVTRIERLEPNGDRTVTRITSVDIGRKFTAAEKQRLFGIVTARQPAK